MSPFRASSITRVQNTPTWRKKEGGRGSRVGVWLFGPALFCTHFDQSTVNDQNGGFSVESPLSKFHTTGLILWRVHISKCLHFCRSLTVWILIEFGPPAEQLEWRGIRQTVPWELLVSLCPAQSHTSPLCMSCPITQLAGASTTGHHPFPSSSFCWQICAETSLSTGQCSILTQCYVTSTNILLNDLSIWDVFQSNLSAFLKRKLTSDCLSVDYLRILVWVSYGKWIIPLNLCDC